MEPVRKKQRNEGLEAEVKDVATMSLSQEGCEQKCDGPGVSCCPDCDSLEYEIMLLSSAKDGRLDRMNECIQRLLTSTTYQTGATCRKRAQSSSLTEGEEDLDDGCSFDSTLDDDWASMQPRRRSSSLDVTNERGLTALMLATKNGHFDVAVRLVEAGADVNLANDRGATAIIFAAQKGYTELVRFLIRSGARVESRDVALIPAAHFGHDETVRLLLAEKADVNFCNSNGTTGLMRASQEGHLDVVKTLLQAGADANVSNRERMTALMLASQRGHPKIAQTLISAGAVVDMQTAQGSTALLLAVKRGNYEAVRVLVAAGADIFLSDERNRGPRDSALRKDFIPLLTLLTQEKQIALMRSHSRVERAYLFCVLRKLFNENRVEPIKSAADLPWVKCLRSVTSLPLPLMRTVLDYAESPRFWQTQVKHFRHRVNIEPDTVVRLCLPLIREILEDSGRTIEDVFCEFADSTLREAAKNLPALGDVVSLYGKAVRFHPAVAVTLVDIVDGLVKSIGNPSV